MLKTVLTALIAGAAGALVGSAVTLNAQERDHIVLEDERGSVTISPSVILLEQEGFRAFLDSSGLIVNTWDGEGDYQLAFTQYQGKTNVTNTTVRAGKEPRTRSVRWRRRR